MQGQCVRRCLHHHGLQAIVAETGEKGLKIWSFRSRMRPGQGADHRRGHPGGIEDRRQQVGGRRLAVRPGDAHHRQGIARMVEEGGADRAGCGAAVRHQYLSDIGRQLQAVFDDDGGGAALNRLGGEAVPVGAPAANAEKEHARFDGSRVEGRFSTSSLRVTAYF